MTLDEGAERLHRLTKELLRRYQFRDWNQVCCYGISISQSHILEVFAGYDRKDYSNQKVTSPTADADAERDDVSSFHLILSSSIRPPCRAG